MGGEAAEAFTKKLGDLPKYLKQGTDSMRDCKQALITWHGLLEGFQGRANGLEEDAIEARSRVKDREATYNAQREAVMKLVGTPITPETESAQRAYETSVQQLNSANDTLQDIIDRAEDLQATWKDRAGDAERAILKASENHPPDFHWWDRAMDGLKAAWRGSLDWLVDNADLLSTISAGLTVVGLALAATGVGAPVAAVVLAGATVASAGAMAGHWMGNARGNGTPAWKIGVDALGVIPGVGAAGKFISGGSKGVKALATLGKGASLMERVTGAGKAVTGMSGSTISSKLGSKLLSKFGKEVAPETVQLGSKALSAVHGAWGLVSGDGGKQESFQPAQPAAPAPTPSPAPLPPPVSTMPTPGPSMGPPPITTMPTPGPSMGEPPITTMPAPGPSPRPFLAAVA